LNFLQGALDPSEYSAGTSRLMDAALPLSLRDAAQVTTLGCARFAQNIEKAPAPLGVCVPAPGPPGNSLEDDV
jgi:hypothetical protein